MATSEHQQRGRRRAGPLTVAFFVALAAALIAAVQYKAELPKYPPGPRSSEKRFQDFGSFYKFYREAHSKDETVFFHALGLGISILMALWQPRVFISVVIAISAGLLAGEVLSAVPHGAVEISIMVALYVLCNTVLLGSHGLWILLIGYGLSWYGHFAYQKNMPNTLVNPAYSFLGDCQQLLDVARGVIPLHLPTELKVPGRNW